MDTVVVPKKHEVPVGTLRNMLSQAQTDSDEWEKPG
jgi:predicted RNA binding protein YcfA (HicA-like mRNA interferase family)